MMPGRCSKRGSANRSLLTTAAVLLAVCVCQQCILTSAQLDSPYLPPSPTDYPSPLPYAPTVVTATPPNPTVPLAKFDCNLLAARKKWTGIKTCSPPPACPLEDMASSTYQTKKGPYWCNKDGQVTVLYLNFQKISPSLHAGTLPSSWGYFPALRILTVIANPKLTGSVPGSFSSLTTLNELDLGFNPKLVGGIPAALAKSDSLSQLRVAGSGLRAKQQEFYRKNFNGNPLRLIVSRTKPEICEEYGKGYPVLVSAVYWSATQGRYLGATLPKCT